MDMYYYRYKKILRENGGEIMSRNIENIYYDKYSD